MTGPGGTWHWTAAWLNCALQQGEIVNEHVDDGGDLAALAARVDVSEDKLREYRRVFLFCEGTAWWTARRSKAHRLAADSGKDRAWLAGFARGSNGRATVDEVRVALGRKPATVE
jgi:hypothetical protein